MLFGISLLDIALGVKGIAMQSSVQTLPYWVQFALFIIAAISAIFAAIGLLLNLRQSRRTNAQARAALVADCLKGFTADEGIQRAFYSIEYYEFRYGISFHKSELERDVDKLLRHFANIALAWRSGLLTTGDIKPMQYYLLSVTRNPEIKKYLEFIEEHSMQLNLGEHPYEVLIELCKALTNDTQAGSQPDAAR